jgi:hypothetical protein
MTRIPAAALWLGLAGLLPFLWGVATMHVAPLETLTLRILGPRFIGPYVVLQYGTVILCFMSGVLWGFSTAAPAHVAPAAFGLSVIPALWAFFTVGGGPVTAGAALLAGFIGLLAIDGMFWARGLTPGWWMHLRIVLTTVVVLCLGAVIIG